MLIRAWRAAAAAGAGLALAGCIASQATDETRGKAPAAGRAGAASPQAAEARPAEARPRAVAPETTAPETTAPETTPPDAIPVAATPTKATPITPAPVNSSPIASPIAGPGAPHPAPPVGLATDTSGYSGDWVDFGVATDSPAPNRPGNPTGNSLGDNFGISLACPEIDAGQGDGGRARSGACGSDPYARIPLGPGMETARTRRDELYLQLYSTRLAGDIEMSVQAKTRAALRWVLPFSP